MAAAGEVWKRTYPRPLTLVPSLDQSQHLEVSMAQAQVSVFSAAHGCPRIGLSDRGLLRNPGTTGEGARDTQCAFLDLGSVWGQEVPKNLPGLAGLVREGLGRGLALRHHELAGSAYPAGTLIRYSYFGPTEN